VADGRGDPLASGTGAALVAGGAEVAAFAGDRVKRLRLTRLHSVRALEAGEAGGEVAATEEGLDSGNGGGVERAEGFAVSFFVTNEEVVPTMVDDLPEGRGAGTPRAIDGRHKKCP
jgi:hypothetical protein